MKIPLSRICSKSDYRSIQDNVISLATGDVLKYKCIYSVTLLWMVLECLYKADFRESGTIHTGGGR